MHDPEDEAIIRELLHPDEAERDRAAYLDHCIDSVEPALQDCLADCPTCVRLALPLNQEDGARHVVLGYVCGGCGQKWMHRWTRRAAARQADALRNVMLPPGLAPLKPRL